MYLVFTGFFLDRANGVLPTMLFPKASSQMEIHRKPKGPPTDLSAQTGLRKTCVVHITFEGTVEPGLKSFIPPLFEGRSTLVIKCTLAFLDFPPSEFRENE